MPELDAQKIEVIVNDKGEKGIFVKNTDDEFSSALQKYREEKSQVDSSVLDAQNQLTALQAKQASLAEIITKYEQAMK